MASPVDQFTTVSFLVLQDLIQEPNFYFSTVFLWLPTLFLVLQIFPDIDRPDGACEQWIGFLQISYAESDSDEDVRFVGVRSLTGELLEDDG